MEKVVKIEKLNEKSKLVIDCSQDVNPINEEYGTDYDGFILMENDELWGYYGVVPYLYKHAYYVGTLDY